VKPRPTALAALAVAILAAAAASILPRLAARKHQARAHGTRAAAPSGRSLFHLDSGWNTDQGGTLRLRDLAGSAQVMAMFFTHCPSVCPILVQNLTTLEASLSDRTRARTKFVLVSIDPEQDTPQALREYRERMGLDPGHWVLLQGQRGQVLELAAVLGFDFAKDEGMDIVHASQVTVLDGEGEIVLQQAGVGSDASKLAVAIEAAADW
jgi:protein SCO1/2